MKRFRNLTQAQFDVLGAISMACDEGHHPKTLAKIETLGLIVGHDEIFEPRSRFPVRIRRYEMPLAIHYEWCQWCAKNTPDDEVDPLPPPTGKPSVSPVAPSVDTGEVA